MKTCNLMQSIPFKSSEVNSADFIVCLVFKSKSYTLTGQ